MRRGWFVVVLIVVLLVGIYIGQHHFAPRCHGGPACGSSKSASPPSQSNAARTCKTSYPGQMPTDICATWGVPVNDANITVTAELPPILTPAPRIDFLPEKNLCSTVSYVDRTSSVAIVGLGDWNLSIDPNDILTFAGSDSGTLAYAILGQGDHTSGTVCGALSDIHSHNASAHGTFMLTCEPGTFYSRHSGHGPAAAARIVWRATL